LNAAATPRNTRAQKLPHPGQNLSAFPHETSTSETKFRAHGVAENAWYFSSSANGRFNLRSPRGTNCFADNALTAIREALGERVSDGQPIFADDAAAFRVSSITPPAGEKYANITDGDAVLHHVNREMCAGEDYPVYQEWAAAFDASGFDGVRYASRFTTDPGPNSWALFGPENEDKTKVNDVLIDDEIDGITACIDAGIKVLDRGPKVTFRILSR
jgi:hypothetical protein